MFWRATCPVKTYRQLLADLGIADDVKNDPRWTNAADVLGGSSKYGWEVKDVWESGLASRTTDEAMDFFESYGMTAFPVNDYPRLFADPQVESIKMVQTLTHPTVGAYRSLGSPWLFADTPAASQGPAPLLGQHTDEALSAAGYPADAIRSLRETGVIR